MVYALLLARYDARWYNRKRYQCCGTVCGDHRGRHDMKKFLALLLALLLIFSLVACGTDTTTKEPVPAAAETDDPGSGEQTADGTAIPEAVDLSAFSSGVTEDGDDVVVTVKNDTDFGETACVMTYQYIENKLAAATADYYVPDEESAELLAEQLRNDASIVPDSIKTDGICVSCQIADDRLEELSRISREELIQVMEDTINGAQEP